MSHELRTPFNPIIGYSDLLVEESCDNRHTNYIVDLQKIRQSGIRLLGLINEIFNLATIEENRMELYIEDSDVRELVAEVASTIASLANQNDYHLQVDMEHEIGTIHSDAGKLRQLLFNLLSNACKFTNHGKICYRLAGYQKTVANLSCSE